LDDPDLRAIAEADSLVVDAHKWLHAPLEAGCLLVRDPLALPSAFDQAPWYADREKVFSEPTLDYLRMGPQTSRAFRALKVWFLLRNLGRQGYITRIQEDIALSQELFEKVDQHPELEAISQQLCIAAFRYVPPDVGSQTPSADYLNRLNAEILYEIQRGGEIYLSNATREGAYLLRACTMNFRTRQADVARIPEIVSSVGRNVHQRMTLASESSPPLAKS
jgi:glutamate/tyrosine decarboxylase-like PLP-dependent enzyme